MKAFSEVNDLSLLWPSKNSNKCLLEDGKLYSFSVTDLGIDELVKAMSINNRYDNFIKSILLDLCDDTDILNYRLEVIEDLLRSPNLLNEISNILPLIVDLGSCYNTKGFDQTPLLQTVRRISELELYVKCINQLFSSLVNAGSSIKSSALSRLREQLFEITEDGCFKSLASNLPAMRSGFEKLSSVTVGINLDEQLRPVEATILSINEHKFKGVPFLDRLFGKKTGSREHTGISELHSILENQVQTGLDRGKPASKDTLSTALQVTLFNDLHRILSRVVVPVSSFIEQYNRISGAFLVNMESEMAFYIGVVRLIERVHSCGFIMCRPEIASKTERVFKVEENFNINLVVRKLNRQPEACLRDKVITNDVSMDSKGRIFILTGPNQGGKTTYIQAIALTQILMQAGIFVPGTNAIISPADNIYTHFPVEEKPGADAGRLGEEARRLGDIFEKATESSLVMLNESLTSTSPGESLYLCMDIVRGLRLLGSRAIFATHLHDLAASADLINSEIPGSSAVISVVAGVVKEKSNSSSGTARTYKITPSPPQGLSYAKDIASRYGISFEQIAQTINGRSDGH